MKHDTLLSEGLSYAPYKLRSSRMFFRGPKRPLDGRYITFIGSTETYGKFIAKPYPALVEERLGEVCVNFGVMNCSIDAFMNEQAVQSTCHKSLVNVVEIMGAHNMSNRFYTVHPRRNDRFLRASTVLRAIFPEVDFSEFCFTRHLVSTLYNLSPKRFDILRAELQEAWSARMRSFLSQIGSHTILLWFSDDLPSDTPIQERNDPFKTDPLFVTRSMVDALRPIVHSVVVVQPSARAHAKGTAGMVYNTAQQSAAEGMRGIGAHTEVAEALVDALHEAVPDAGRKMA